LKLTIGKQILFGYGLAMLWMAITGIAGYRSTEQLREADDGVGHAFLVIGAAEDMQAGLLEFESACRGYVATGDELFLEPVESLRTRLADSRKLLRTLTADNPAQQHRLDGLDPAVDRRLASLVNMSNMRRGKGFSAALAAMQQADGGERRTEIGNSLMALESEERSLLNAWERTAQLEARSAGRVILYGNLFGSGLAAWVGIATYLYIRRRLGEFRQLVTSVGDGDLTGKPAREGADELGKLAHGLNQVVARLRSTTTQTRAATENLNAAAIEMMASAREQSAVTGEQVAAYQETNATMQQVSQSCLQMSEKAKEVTTTAEAVSSASISGLDAVQKANQTVESIHEQAEAVAQNIVSLSEKTQMVGDILATVNDIAEQSHLLALNAAIEAAAAGEHGRSFAVVASEIKNLADQSKSATVQVKTILGDIQKEINTSVMLTEEAVKRVDLGKHQADMAASAIRNMAANIGQSVQAFQQIVAGSNQQLMGFENVMQAMKDLSRSSEQASGTTRQTEKAASNLTELGQQLRAATEGYRL
jgi:methyl-accepting chemotaxis protein